MNKKIDFEHLVMNAILIAFPTEVVEKYLSLEASLTDDLGLSSIDVFTLGLSIEKELQYLNFESFTDAQITGWKTVKDIIDTASSLKLKIKFIPKEIPLLYSTPMVQSTINGTKTMTRRTRGLDMINSNPNDWKFEKILYNEKVGNQAFFSSTFLEGHDGWFGVKCPYGKPGDLIWVRETWKVGYWNDLDHKVAFDYRASPELKRTPWSMYEDIGRFDEIHQKTLNELLKLNIEPVVDEKNERFHYRWVPGQSPLKWKPNIFMPKEAARIWLRVEEIRVERLHDISEEDAIAEGIQNMTYESGSLPAVYYNYLVTKKELEEDHWAHCAEDAKDSFKSLWISINGRESWDANPYVWVIKFKVLSTTGKPEFSN